MSEVAVELREYDAIFDDGINDFVVRHGAVFALGVADGFDDCEGVDTHTVLKIVEFVEEGVVFSTIFYTLL